MNVPKLRFCEFCEDYKRIKLKDITELITKGTTPEKYSEIGVNFIKVENISDNRIKNIGSFISYETHNNELKRSILKENDILFSIAGALGRTAIVTKNELPANTNQACSIIRFNNLNDINLYYLMERLNHIDIKNYINKCQSVGAQPNLSLEQIGKICINIPNKKEQDKVGRLIELVNKKIELQSQKIEALKLYKKGLIDKIYLMDIYDKITLKNLFNSYGGTSLESYVSDKGTYNFISIGNYSMDGEYINNNQKIVLNDKTKDKLLNKNDLVMILNDKTSSGDIIGSTILIDEDNKYIYNQRSQRLVCKKEILPEYAWCYLNTSKHRRKVFSHSQGGTQIYINFSQIEKMQVLLPKDFKNQKIISTIIIDTCNKIKLNEIKLKELRKLKKGLMQNMFV